MPVSKQSQSDPGFLKEIGRSARNAGLGAYRTGRRIVKTKKSPTQTAGTAAVVTGLACLFPLPFAVLGAMHVIDNALNGDEANEDLKAEILAKVEELTSKAKKKVKEATRAVADPVVPAAG